MQVRFERGIELPQHHHLWLDPWDAKPFAFISHAHSDHTAPHKEIITSVNTARLLRERMPGERVEHLLEFGINTRVNDLSITLLPAGHIFGSAQLFLETEEGSLLYTGDFKLRQGLSAEPIEWQHAKTLIMETTFGLPQYCFPPTETVLKQILEFCTETLEAGATPVLLGYSLGKSQEILCALVKNGFTAMLHESCYRLTKIYKELRPDFPDFEKFDLQNLDGKVLICPPHVLRGSWIKKIGKHKTAMLTGWAIDPDARFRYQCDAAFPLSDHADYNDLLRYVELVQPERVLTVHGYAAQFARDLRERGIEAFALNQENQLELKLNIPFDTAAPKAESAQPHESSEFFDFTQACEAIRNTSSKLEKIAILTNYFRSLSAESVEIAAVYFTGNPFARVEGKTLQIGGAVIRKALREITRLSEHRYREIANQFSDTGRTASEILSNRTTPKPWSLQVSRAFFHNLHSARGPIQKTHILKNQLRELIPLEAEYLIRIVTGDLRIGLKEGLVEEALATAFGTPADTVREAHMLLGDLGKVARRLKNKETNPLDAELFTPIRCMLASPEPTAESIWERLGESRKLWLEDKYDGIRAQLHHMPGHTEIFSRDLLRITAQFPEITNAVPDLQHKAIFDGEIIAFDTTQQRALPFFDLQKRLGRKEADLFLTQEIPILYIIFDLLWLDDISLLKTPLQERRQKLESLQLPAIFQRAPLAEARSAQEVEQAFKNARGRLNEGLIVKDPASFYTPGRRGMAWLKLKKELATLDVVVVGVETGHGRRSQVLSDYTFAVRDAESGKFLPIGKAYSGLTDKEIEELTEHFKNQTISIRGRYREVVPDVVLEIAFDSIQPSNRHPSGLALRFPRIKAIRTDKDPLSIDTLDYARELMQRRFANSELHPTA